VDSSQRVTLADIAERAGVSVPTVARILAGGNKERWASAAARAERIRAIAHELGYRPDQSARRLAGSGRPCIVLAFGSEAPFMGGLYTPVMPLAIRWLEARGFDLLPVPLIGPAAEWTRRLVDQRVDGILVMQPAPRDLGELVTHYKIPAVLLNLASDLPLPQVLADDAAGMRRAVDHLAGLEHRRIAYVEGSIPQSEDHYHIELRRRSVLRRARHHELTCSVIAEAGGADLLHALDAGAISGVICRTDPIAVDLLHTLWHAGRRVPESLSVIGINDEFCARHVLPPLTSVKVPVEAMVEQGLQALLDLLAGRKVPPRIRLDEPLVLRGSTAPPAGGSRRADPRLV
jgi:DNA-binding LacI/PurR family transcriptional regulator